MNPFVLQVSRNPLPNFSPKVVVVGAMICVESEFLLLERCASVSQPLTWSLPAGKVEAGESLEEGLRREL
ncbi:MAG: NUDIX domain-containing protein, partial [Chlamydiia bacterium]|nr:NUDIX domain-containing protein [Chlamydiia bacterium]